MIRHFEFMGVEFRYRSEFDRTCLMYLLSDESQHDAAVTELNRGAGIRLATVDPPKMDPVGSVELEVWPA